MKLQITDSREEPKDSSVRWAGHYGSNSFLACQDSNFGRPIFGPHVDSPEEGMDKEFNHLFLMPFLPEDLQIDTSIKRMEFWSTL